MRPINQFHCALLATTFWFAASADAAATYQQKCAGCHLASNTPEVNFLPNGFGTSGSIRAANNRAYLDQKILDGMGAFNPRDCSLPGGTNPLSCTDRDAIVAEIGASMSVAPAAITTSAPPGGIFNMAYSFDVNATGQPTPGGLSHPNAFTISAGSLPPGLSMNSNTGLISGTPTSANNGVAYTGTISVSNLVGAPATQNFSIVIAKAVQSITFGGQTTPRTFSPGATFTISPTASASSGLTISYSSDTTSVCTVSGTTVTMVAAGNCTLRANQGGDANYNPAGPATTNVVIDKGTQSITFGAQTVTPAFVSPSGGTFNLAPAASATSGLAITYVSTTPAVCSKNGTGTLVTIVAQGSCTIEARQNGDGNWNAATAVARSIPIARQSQTITFNPQTSATFVLNDTFTLTPAASTSASGLAVSYASTTPATCSVATATSPVVTMLASGTCTIRASQSGNTNVNQAATVDRNISLTAFPAAPVATLALSDVNQRTIISFTPPENPESITQYTGTCTASGQTTRTGTATQSPVVVPSMTNGVQYSCTVSATNAFGTSPQSNALTATPSSAARPPAIVSANNASFELGKAGSFQIVSPGGPPPNFSISSGSLPSGITLTAGAISGTANLAGIAAPGTAGVSSFTISAIATGGSSQTFTLTITKGNPVISFGALANRVFSSTPVALTASIATPAGAISASFIAFSSATPATCTVSGSSVTLVQAGTCTIAAGSITGNATYNASYNAAPSVMQSFQITQATQNVTFPTQTTATRVFAPGGTFAIAPLATASSGLAVTYMSNTPGICTVAGSTATMLGAGTCTIVASQDGNANYLSATAMQSVTIDKAAQAITFPVQFNRSFIAGSSFAVNPAATASSGLPVSYASLSTGICTVNGSTVTMVAIGTCTLRASQGGGPNHNAATPVDRSLFFLANTPSAPSLTEAVGSDGRVTLTFTPPASNGGSPITGYIGSCDDGVNVTATGDSSPILVTGLTNRLPTATNYKCRVVAINAVGAGQESNALNPSPHPFLDSGENLWGNVCSTCHGPVPAGVRFNAAGKSAEVLMYVIANQPQMNQSFAVNALSTNELEEITKYIGDFVPPISVVTPFNTPIDIDVSSHITLNTISFTGVEAGETPPANGNISAINGTVITYVPNAGFTGIDVFDYMGARSMPKLKGFPRGITITVLPPDAPVITSAATASGSVGTALNYQITASNAPTGFGATGLNGLSLNAISGLISGTPASAGTFVVNVTAMNAGGTSMPQAVTFTIAPGNQTISFGAQAGQGFVANGTFAINPQATASSGLAVTYSSNTPGVCSVSGTTVTMMSAGTCTIAANQGGSANYNAALTVTRDIVIAATVPGAPIIGSGTPGSGSATIAFAPPASDGGSAITGYSATCTPSGSGSNSVSPIVVGGLNNGTPYSCTVRAMNAAGTGAASGSVSVTPSGAPVPPVITSGSSVTFTVGAAGNFVMTASGSPTPSLSLTGTLPSGVTFTGGTSPRALAGTPAAGSAGSYPLTLSATNGNLPDASQSFTLTVQKASQTIAFSGPGPQTFSAGAIVLSATASSGLTVSFSSSTTGVCTVSGTTLTMISTGVCSINANQTGDTTFNAAPQVTQAFSIAQASQSITFPAQSPATRDFAPGAVFAISPLATASSGLPVTYSSTTTGICTVTGTSVTIAALGTCTIAANQAGSATFAAAMQATRNVSIVAAVPAAPAIGNALAGNGQATVSFTPPSFNGGSAITGYAVTCGAITANGSASPIVVTGLANNVAVSCSVRAINAVGTGSPSASVMVTPSASQGPAIWAAVCDNCHTVVPSGNQLNGAGVTGSVLAHVRATQPLMVFNSAVQALTAQDLNDLAVFIAQNLAPISATVPANTATAISVASHITLTGQTWSAFTSVEVVTPPAYGTLSAFAGGSVTYTPNAGYTGPDSFSYRGRRSGPTVVGDAQTVNIHVASNTFALAVSNGGAGFGSVSGTGIACGSDCSELFAPGTMVTLTATPLNGASLFSSWSGPCNSTAGNQCSVTMDAAKSITAVFNLAPTVPEPPENVSASPGDGFASITFSPPLSNGGAPITAYTATCQPGNFSATGATSPLMVTGLTNGVTYNCSVTATNSVGEGFASATVGVTPAVPPGLTLTGVKSRKVHGAAGTHEVDINAATALTGAVDVEPRAIGSGHQIVFQFSGAITAAGTVTVTDTSANPVGNHTVAFAGNEVIVTLTAIPDRVRVLVAIDTINGAAVNVSAAVGFLLGDVNNSRAVTASDIAGIKVRNGQTTNASNFRLDLNTSGTISAADVAMAKAGSGTTLP